VALANLWAHEGAFSQPGRLLTASPELSGLPFSAWRIYLLPLVTMAYLKGDLRQMCSELFHYKSSSSQFLEVRWITSKVTRMAIALSFSLTVWFCFLLKECPGAGWVVRERVGAGGRNDPSIVCTYE
jgi:hypothetical protein